MMAQVKGASEGRREEKKKKRVDRAALFCLGLDIVG